MPAIEIDADGQELTPEFLRKRGLRGAYRAELGLRLGDARAEKVGRAALADLVDAFLHDRRGNANLFARAHRLGLELSLHVGCHWTPGQDRYELRCAIFALHRPVAHSVAWTLDSVCSICGAGPFSCEHIPDETYDGELCELSVGGVLGTFDHIAFTANPDFIYTWHQPQTVDVTRLKADGAIKRVGDRLRCTHCRECPGLAGPNQEDLDPVGRWERLVAQNTSRDAQELAIPDQSEAARKRPLDVARAPRRGLTTR
jgi:hypothetical protein